MPLRLVSVCLLAAAALAAQSPLTTTFANNNGGTTGSAIYFDLTAVAGGGGVTITEFDLNFLSAGASGSIDVYLAPPGTAHTEPEWVLVTSALVASANPAGVPTNCPLAAPIELAENCAVRVAIVANGLVHAYTTGTGVQLTYATAELRLHAGGASNVPFAGTLFSPRLVNANVRYSNGGVDCPQFARTEKIGSGCVPSYASIYQLTTLSTFAASNTLLGLDFIRTGAGYLVTESASALLPVGTLDPTAVPLVGVGDDVAVAVGTLGLEFGSNGWLALGSGNSIYWVPDTELLLNNAAAQFSCWSDYQPNAGGVITYEEAGTRALLTFEQVFAWGTTDPNTFQFEVDVATGNAGIRFGAMAASAAQPLVIGYSPGGSSADPGSTDLAAELGSSGLIAVAAADAEPLTLTQVSRPVQGAAASNWDVAVSNMSPGAIFHVGIVGLSGVNLPLGPIGFPVDCRQYVAADLLVGQALVAGQGTHPWTALMLPGLSPSLVGLDIYAQSVVLDLSLLSATARASNSLKGTIGTL